MGNPTRRPRPRSLRGTLLLALLGVNFFVLGIYEIPTFFMELEDQRRDFEALQSRTLERLRETLKVPIWNYDSVAVEQIIAVEVANPHTKAIRILYPETDEPIPHFDRDYEVSPAPKNHPIYGLLGIDLFSLQREEIRYSDEYIADLEILFAFPDLVDRWNELLFRIAIESLMFFVLISLIISFIFQRLVHEPLGQILGKLDHLTRGEFGYPLQVDREDEMGTLARGIMAMERELSSLYQRLQEHNSELQATVELRTASLVESEKRASVSRLVTGIAHELNTPIGISLTMASHRLEKLRELARAYKQGQVTKSMMERYLESGEEGLGLLLNTINHSIELIQSFKRVSVDHFTEEMSVFDIRGYIEKIVPSVGKLLDAHRIILGVSGDRGLMVRSYPNFLTQIILNLIMNTTMHAYGPEATYERHAAIEVEALGTGALVRYANNGRPIPPEHRNHVWEAFYTTSRGSGGTGLGMFIIKGIIEQQLHGTIRIAETLPRCLADYPGEGGVCFEFTIPEIGGTS